MLVYVSLQLPLTIYILEGFFARIPQRPVRCRADGRLRNSRSSGASRLPIGMPAIATTVILNFILLWNEFLYAVVLITDDDKRTLPLGIQRFMGDQLEDIGMIATGADDRDRAGDHRLRVLLREADPGHDGGRRQVTAVERIRMNGTDGRREARQDLQAL